MKRLFLFLFFSIVSMVAMQAQILTCRIDGPANVRQQPSTKSRVMGSIKNGCIAKVSKVSDNFWYIHEVYNPRGGAAYTGKAVGYYTHRQNVILDGGQYGSDQRRQQRTVTNNLSWLYGQWRHVDDYGVVNIYISENRIKEYGTLYSTGRPELWYDGPYTIEMKGGGMAELRLRDKAVEVTYVILIDLNKKIVYADTNGRERMQKVR